MRLFKRKKEYEIDRKIEIGLIIGTETDGIFSKWLGEYNDGLVNSKECMLGYAKDTLFLPLVHDEIHKKMGTAKYINNFISKGQFRVD